LREEKTSATAETNQGEGKKGSHRENLTSFTDENHRIGERGKEGANIREDWKGGSKDTPNCPQTVPRVIKEKIVGAP